MKGRAGRVLRRIASGLTSTLIGGLLVLVTAGVLSGYRTFVVQSGSMGATAPVGSVVLTRPIPATDIGVGDVIVIERAGVTPVLHRVVGRVERDGLVEVRTQGDQNHRPDPGSYGLSDEALRFEGLVVPRLGYAFATLRTPRGWLTVAALAAALVAAVWLRRYWRTQEGKDP